MPKIIFDIFTCRREPDDFACKIPGMPSPNDFLYYYDYKKRGIADTTALVVSGRTGSKGINGSKPEAASISIEYGNKIYHLDHISIQQYLDVIRTSSDDPINLTLCQYDNWEEYGVDLENYKNTQSQSQAKEAAKQAAAEVARRKQSRNRALLVAGLASVAVAAGILGYTSSIFTQSSLSITTQRRPAKKMALVSVAQLRVQLCDHLNGKPINQNDPLLRGVEVSIESAPRSDWLKISGPGSSGKTYEGCVPARALTHQ